jgi:acyl carrier protein
MSDNAHITEIRDLIQSRFPMATISDSDDLFALGYIDSLFIAELVTFLETTFEITLTYDALSFETLRSIEAMADMVARSCGEPVGDVA